MDKILQRYLYLLDLWSKVCLKIDIMLIELELVPEQQGNLYVLIEKRDAYFKEMESLKHQLINGVFR